MSDNSKEKTPQKSKSRRVPVSTRRKKDPAKRGCSPNPCPLDNIILETVPGEFRKVGMAVIMKRIEEAGVIITLPQWSTLNVSPRA